MTHLATPARIAAALADAVLRPGDAAGAGAAITDVVHDSRQAGPGALFAARPGATADGHDFAPAAVAAGASALLVQRPLPDLDVPQVVVPDVADALGHVADLVHHHPSRAIAVIGMTGTNGKTTTAYLVDAIWRADGRRSGLVGTVETRIGEESVAGTRTTPEASDMHRLFARMRAAGVTAAAIEVSSHGLELGRLNGVTFAATLFTNLTQDHLDFHPDMAAYFRAKARLFTPDRTPLGVITVDDEWGARLAASAPVEVWTLSRAGTAAGAPVDVTAVDVVTTADGATFTAVVRGARTPVRIALPGDYNVTNALGAIATTHAAGVPLDVAAAGVGSLAGVPGRMERVDAGQPFGVLVDYAHTPDAVAGVLRAARGVTDGRVIVVLGCGGDRDRVKRPLMARAAVDGADVAVLTSDNPRTEDPEAILDDMIAGLPDPHGAVRIADRAAAIAAALGMAARGDVVVIAGKGHEPYQELASGRTHFDDREVARAALVARGVA